MKIFLACVLLILGAAAAAEVPDPELREALREAANATPSFIDRFDAEVWLVDMSARLERQMPDPEERVELLQLVHMEAARAELPPELVLAVIDVESNFDRYAVSVAGALGLMQIMPFWKDEIGRPGDNLLHTSTNLRYGCTILKHYYDKEKGDLQRALGRAATTAASAAASTRARSSKSSTASGSRPSGSPDSESCDRGHLHHPHLDLSDPCYGRPHVQPLLELVQRSGRARCQHFDVAIR